MNVPGLTTAQSLRVVDLGIDPVLGRSLRLQDSDGPCCDRVLDRRQEGRFEERFAQERACSRLGRARGGGEDAEHDDWHIAGELRSRSEQRAWCMLVYVLRLKRR